MNADRLGLVEEYFFFISQGCSLYSSFHRLKQEITRPTKGIVLCAPYVNEDFKVYRILFNLCRHLAEKGYASLRFDYAGTGDSGGAFEDAEPQDWIRNVVDAVGILSQKCPETPVVLVGCRLGAVWAMLAAEQLGRDVCGVVLWDPVFDVKNYLYNQLRGNLSEQMVLYGKVIEDRDRLVAKIEAGTPINVGGFHITKAFFEQGCAINLLKNSPQYQGNVKIVVTQRSAVDEGSPEVRFLRNYRKDCSPADIVRVPKEFSWEVTKGYLTRLPKTFDSLVKVLGE